MQNVVASYVDEFHSGGTNSCRLFLGNFFEDPAGDEYAPAAKEYQRLQSFPEFKARTADRKFQISGGPTVVHVSYFDVFGEILHDRVTYATEWELNVERRLDPLNSGSPGVSYLTLFRNSKPLDTPKVYTRRRLDPACYEMFEVEDMGPQYLNR